MDVVMLTGATGFIGNAVLRKLIERKIYVIATARSSAPDNIPQSPYVEYIPCDMDQLDSLGPQIADLKMKPEIFYHFAWEGINPETRKDPVRQVHNIYGMIHSLRLAKEIGCKRFIGAGSIMEKESFYATTNDGNHPGIEHIYGSTKMASYMVGMPLAVHYGIEFIWGEITNAYGVGDTSNRLINYTLRNVLMHETPKFTQATQNYDFIYIDDVAEAFLQLGEKGKAFHRYCIGSAEARPLKEYLTAIQNVLAPDLPFEFGSIPYTGVGLPLSEFDCTMLEQDTGFKAKIDFEVGIKDTFEWLKASGGRYEKN